MPLPHLSNQITDSYKLNLILQTRDGFTNYCGCVHPRMTDMTNDNTDILVDRTLSSQIQLLANVWLGVLIIQKMSLPTGGIFLDTASSPPRSESSYGCLQRRGPAPCIHRAQLT